VAVVPDHSQDRVTIWMSEQLRDQMAEYIDWRYESESQWCRESVQTRMWLADALAAQDVELPDDADRRQALVEMVVRRGVAAAGADLPTGESD
jgi:hypothetical protein